MSLNKAIAHGKEKRKPYGKCSGTFAKSVSFHCRNHGGKRHKKRNNWECEWCKDNRQHANKKREDKAKSIYNDNKMW